MALVYLLLTGSGFYPVWRAWQANNRTSLNYAVLWAAVAWLAWSWLFAATWAGQDSAIKTCRYLALSLTAGASMAVLGARRPGAGAWNFVLLGLLAVMLLPLAENWLAGGELRA